MKGKGTICDEILRIEMFHEEVLEASTNQQVGVCLPKISKEQLLAYLNCSKEGQLNWKEK
ncbi:MAG: hypothetical protein NT165_02570 [Candidatus Falkowbacteria bacterium]|nr:hypothetical protein [Candidatus Falkowbacteria bacterium]